MDAAGSLRWRAADRRRILARSTWPGAPQNRTGEQADIKTWKGGMGWNINIAAVVGLFPSANA
jgi:hypothetical protein